MSDVFAVGGLFLSHILQCITLATKMRTLSVVSLLLLWSSSGAFSPSTNNVPSPRPDNGSLKATWSDSKAVMDYQNFLNSGKQEIELADDGPSVIIRSPTGDHLDIVDGLWAMGMGDDMVLTPDQPLPTEMGGRSEYPIYIALRPWEIQNFLINLEDSYRERNEDFVFLSGGLEFGNIEDVLKERGYCRDSMTQFLASGLRVTPAKTVQDLSAVIGTDNSGVEKVGIFTKILATT